MGEGGAAAGDGLVGAFAAAVDGEGGGGEGFAGGGVARGDGDEVDIEGADDGDSGEGHFGCAMGVEMGNREAFGNFG